MACNPGKVIFLSLCAMACTIGRVIFPHLLAMAYCVGDKCALLQFHPPEDALAVALLANALPGRIG